jgi:hypothetical protein
MSLGLSFAVIVACSAPAAPAAGEDKPASGKQFTVEVKAAKAVKPGEKGAVEVVIKPAKGYKWNKDFPSAFALQGESPVAQFERKEWEKDDFADDGKKATLKVPFEGREAGEATVTGKARFSVCNDETCLIFTDEAVEMKVSVR